MMYQKYSYLEKIKNDTSSSSTSRPNPEDETQTSYEENTYEIVQGDTLWDIAEREYGSGFLYPKIIEKNPGKTFKFQNGREGLIYPGTILIL